MDWDDAARAHLKGRLRRLLDLLRRVKTPQRRSEMLTALRFGGDQFQSATFTTPDRYPLLFTQCELLLRETTAPSILSFGCSTGEEAHSLATRMPHANILGVDINSWCVQEARRRYATPSVRFAHVRSSEFEQAAGFDAIFCMAVLQRVDHRSEGATEIREGLTFERFEQELEKLDRKLRPGGLFFLDNADFLFTATRLAGSYDAVVFAGSAKTRNRPLFDRNNRRIAEEYTAERCFRKRADRGILLDPSSKLDTR